jgi:transglutaminase-like putative cysteine protease
MSGDRDAPRHGARPASALAYLEVGLAVAAVATAGLAYGGYFATRAYRAPLLAAAVVGAVVAAVAARRRWGLAATALAAAAGFAVLAVFTVFTSTLSYGVPTLDTPSALWSGLLHGWARMLTVGLPADATAELLVTPVLLAWSAAFVAAILILRTTLVLAPAAAPLTALVAALLFTASLAGEHVAVTAVVLLETLLLVLVRANRLPTAEADGISAAAAQTVGVDLAAQQLRATAARVAFGVPVVLGVTLLGVAGARLIPVATGDERFDPRDLRPPRLEVEDTLTPLVTLKSQLRADPAERLFTVRVDNPDAGIRVDRVRTAALDDFDGALWTSDDSFLLAGRSLAPNPSLADARRVSFHVAVDRLAGPYLPVIGWPVQVKASRVGFSDTSGVLVTDAATSQGMSYDVVGELRADDALRAAVPDATGDTRYTALPPGLPPEIQAEAATLTTTAAAPYAKLKAIEAYLRRLPYSLDARPGHSYDALRRLLSSDSQDRAGYAEQHAAAFAVMARSQGFPTRVAVGYKLRPGERRGNTYTVTTRDAHAWAEVNLAGYGWVPFDPTDEKRSGTSAKRRQETPSGADSPSDSQQPGSQPQVDPNLTASSSGIDVVGASILALVVLVALLVALPTAVATEKARRRRRRRRGSLAAQVVGAWQETTDRLVERGVGVAGSMTAREVADRAEEELGEAAAAVAELAPIVTTAVFCPVEPDADTVREAWELDAQLRRDLRQGGGIPLAALRALFDPRPLPARWRDRRRSRRAMERLRGG